MTSALLNWIARGLVLAVLASTLWMAHLTDPEADGTNLMLTQVAAAPAGAAASSPAAAAR